MYQNTSTQLEASEWFEKYYYENGNENDNENEINNGIVNINGYIIWKYAKLVKHYIFNYLHEKFHDSLIIYEFNKIDIIVLKERLPIEVQSTIIEKNKNIRHSHFENVIRKQLEDNIENYGKCWFFFDSEYYRYLNERAKNVSMNLDWLSKYVKEDKLKIFTVRFDGIVKELKYEDLSFIRNLSNTCKMEYENDDRILNRNKINILYNILNGYKFTQNEIDDYIKEFHESKFNDCSKFLRKDKNNKKRNLYGNILYSIGSLEDINKLLDLNESYTSNAKRCGEFLGIFETNGKYGTSSLTQIVDKFNVCQYFPGYIRNKELWNSFEKRSFTDRNLRSCFNFKNDKKQHSLFDY